MFDTKRISVLSGGEAEFLRRVRGTCISSLGRMYLGDGEFAFRIRRDGTGTILEGKNPRYDAIVAIGLSREEAGTAATVVGDGGIGAILSALRRKVGTEGNLGNSALALWAAAAGGADRDDFRRKLLSYRPEAAPYPTVEVAWALAALVEDRSPEGADAARRIAARLVAASPAGIFPHVLGDGGGRRGHVACFADQVYPVQALARFHGAFGDEGALEAAARTGRRICDLQGAEGQWWWHYDVRTGSVLEGYPVYAIHQDAMAPMALFDLFAAGGPDLGGHVARGVRWLSSSVEIGGRSLHDEVEGVVWRKVARREPGKATRYLQAGLSALHPSFRLPAADLLFPPLSIDREDRPYHPGWFFEAWSPRRRPGGEGA